MFNLKKLLYVCPVFSSISGSASPANTISNPDLIFFSFLDEGAPFSRTVSTYFDFNIKGSPIKNDRSSPLPIFPSEAIISPIKEPEDSFETTFKQILFANGYETLAPINEELSRLLDENQINCLSISTPPRILWDVSELLKLAIVREDEFALHQAILLYCVANLRVCIDLQTSTLSCEQQCLKYTQVINAFQKLLEEELRRSSLVYSGMIGSALRPNWIHTPLGENQSEVLEKFNMAIRYLPNIEMAIRLDKTFEREYSANWLNETKVFSVKNRILTPFSSQMPSKAILEKTYEDALTHPNLILPSEMHIQI